MTERTLHYAKRAVDKIAKSGEFCLQMRSSSEEAQSTNGYLYFTHLSGKPLPTKGCFYAIQHGLLHPNGDGLFEGFDQTYEARP